MFERGGKGGRGEKMEAVRELEEACNENMGATEREAAAYMWKVEGRWLYEWWRLSKSLLAGKICGVI